MSQRPAAPADTELSERIRNLRIVRARLFDVDVDRKKRIDGAIDYFGAGRDPCGESLLDDAGTH